MRIGYSFWGFLGDYKEDEKGNPLSTPDGNAAYGGFLIDALQRAGHTVYFLQQDRDWPAFQRRGKYDFSAFSQDRRFNAYLKSTRSPEAFPELDILLLEWRFPIPGRNCDETNDIHPTTGERIYSFDEKKHQPDWARQVHLLQHYSDKKTKIIVWDLDYKLAEKHEKSWRIDAVLETAVAPRKGLVPRYRVEPPVAVQDLLDITPMPLDTNRKLVYVGSRYERDDVIDEWIKPVSDRFPQQVEFFGNWTAEYNFEEVKKRWPNVKYRDRITAKDFFEAYGSAVACPLLAKRSYLENGFITPRIWEALIFGTIPVGLKSHFGIAQYLPAHLTAANAEHLGNITLELASLSGDSRRDMRERVAHNIMFMDASNFVRVIERIANG